MRPLLLKGHTRPLTHIKYNREGDLLFTAAKDHSPCVWYAHNGERLGTYDGHNGSVWCVDVSWDTDRLLTGSSDTTCKLWQVETGKELFSFQHKAMVRSVGFSHGERMILTVQDSSFSQQATLFIYNLKEDLKEQEEAPVRSMFEPEMKKQNVALWGNLNQTVISGGDDGAIRVWDVETGKQVNKITDHKKAVNSIQYSKDHTMFITASADHSAKLYDAKNYELLKTFTSDRPLNDAAISPLMNHVIIGGGQEAMNVTVTSAKVGHFEVDFYQLVYAEKLGSVKGHFGPVNTLAFNPDGKSYASGSEDGYIRLHHFDKEYFQAPNY